MASDRYIFRRWFLRRKEGNDEDTRNIAYNIERWPNSIYKDDKSKWYYIKTIDLDKEPVESYKLIIPSARPNESFTDSKNLEILRSDESFGRTKMCIYDSSHIDKVNCCKKYLSTKFAKVINLMTPDSFLYYLPDFDSVYEKIDWSKSLDEIDDQLITLFKINNKDAELIKNINNLFD